jgi:hypothetical protein
LCLLLLHADGSKLSIPKELWRLVDALWSGNALKEKDLFNSKADPAEVQYESSAHIAPDSVFCRIY